MQKTKIVCTIGPASEKKEVLAAMMQNGMNVARLNFSHSSHQDHLEKIILLRKLSAELNKPVAILLDMAGRKIRIGTIPIPVFCLNPVTNLL